MRRPRSKEQIEAEKEKELAKYQQNIYRARCIRETINTEGWKIFVNPWLSSQRQELTELCRFNPSSDQADIQKLALLNAHFSGKIECLESLMGELARWVKIGEEAAASVKLQEEREHAKSV